MTHSRFVLATLLALPSLAAAQTTPEADPSLAEQSPYRWGLGLGAIASDSPFAGEGTRINPVPLILFEGERVFLRGITGGYHIVKGETFSLDAIAALRMDGVAADDLGSEELARNGIDRALLEDRDDSLDLGLVGTWEGAAGEFEFTAKADVTGTSEGYELTARYGYPITVGRGRLTPSVSVSHSPRTWPITTTARWTKKSRAVWWITSRIRPPCRPWVSLTYDRSASAGSS